MSEEDRPDLGAADRIVRTLASDPTLRPLAIVILLIAGTFLAGAVLVALRARNLFAIAGLFLLVLMTLHVLDGARRQGGMLPTTWALVAVWVTTAAIAIGLSRLGVF